MKTTPYLAGAAILILATASLVLYFLVRYEQDRCQQLAVQAREASVMARDYQAVLGRVTRIETAAKGEKRGLTTAISELLSNLGIQSSLRSLKSIEQKKLSDLSRQDAELLISGLDINEAVNLLYVIEKYDWPLTLRSVEMNRTFESPDILDLRLIISYFQKK